MSAKSPRIGFDRFVKLDWCDSMLNVATHEMELSELDSLVSKFVSGPESRRKTLDVLKRLWLTPFPENAEFINRGLVVYKKYLQNSKALPLHWGASLVTYSFFGKTSEIIGRLFNLQDDFLVSDVQRRMAEIYGDRDGITRSTSRVIQSQLDWGVIFKCSDGKRIKQIKPLEIDCEEVMLWLMEALIRYLNKPIPLDFFNSSPALFPFIFKNSSSYYVARSKFLELRTESGSQQFVGLKSN